MSAYCFTRLATPRRLRGSTRIPLNCRASYGPHARPSQGTPINPVVALAVTGMNDVLNSQGYTLAPWWNRIPIAAWVLMAAVAVSCNLLIGYVAYRTNRRLF